MAKTVVGLFDSRSDAQSALSELEGMGFGRNNVSYVENPSGQLVSMLANAGIPREDAGIYSSGVQNGGALIVAQAIPDGDADQVADVLDRYNVVDIEGRGQMSQQTTTTRNTMRTSGSTSQRSNRYEGGDMVIPIVAEEIHVGKREVESGGVRVQTHVEERPVNEQVTLREETVQVERRPVNQPADASMINQAFQEGSVEIRERDEQAVVSKEARVVEEVVINKEVGHRTETIQDTVRRTDVDVEQVPGQTTTSGYTQTSGTTSRGSSSGGTTGNEGTIERGASSLGNAAERLTGADIDRDGDVGKRDPRNNI